MTTTSDAPSSNLRNLLAEARAYVLSFAAITKHPTAPADAHDLVRRIDAWLKESPAETKAPLDSEFEMAMRRAGIREPLEVYTSNSYRRVGLKSEYKVVLSAIRHNDGQTDISNTTLLEALVAAFNAMLARQSQVKTPCSEIGELK